MIESDPQTQCSHLLLVFVKNDEVAIDSIVLRDQVQQWNSDVAQSQEVATFHGVGVVQGIDTTGGPIVETGSLLNVVSNLEDSPLSLQVVEDLRVHLDLDRVSLLVNWVQAVVEHATCLLAVWEPRGQLSVFVEEGGQDDKIHSVLEDLGQDAPSVHLGVVPGLDSPIERTLIDSCKMLDVLDALFQVCDLVYVEGEKRVQRNLSVDVGLTVHETARVRVGTSQTFLDQLLFPLEVSCLTLGQVLGHGLVADLQRELTNDAVCTLAVARPVEEEDAVQNSLLVLSHVASLTIVVVPN